MCGIVGAINLRRDAPPLTASYLMPMRESMKHRGPDGSGTWISPDGRVALGHRRLSIIDLSANAAQPMCNADGSLCLVFNGEIYNHAEIRRELQNLGVIRWTTDHSDTEVILHAFAQWGIDCLHKFRGMFALALWDQPQRELWLVRDRIGIKPLYYSVHNNRLIFASEIKALLEDPEQRREVDEQAFYHYLSFLTTPAPNTLFRGIRKLAGGTWLRVKLNGAIEERRYWDAWDNLELLTGLSEDEIAERLLAELRTSVKLRKISDVPVGVFLSGGIDSSINAKLFSEDHNGPVQTFSIGYDRDYKSYPSELPYARRMAEYVGAQHHERILTQHDLINFLPEMIWLQDEPIADPVCVPVYYVSKLARDNGVVVCQVGEGSDELFCGYRYWRFNSRLQQLANFSMGRTASSLGLRVLGAAGHEESRPYEWLRRAAEGLPVFWGGAEAFTEAEKQQLLSPRLRRSLAGFTSWDALQPIHNRFRENAWEHSPLAWMTYLDLNLRLPELLLMRVDKMSMGVSLEARVPFLDHKLVELALGIPDHLKLKGGVLKYILKKAVRGLIPDEVVTRRKQGFQVPVREWFFDRLGAFARAELRDFCAQNDYLDAQGVDRLLDRRDWRAWYLLNFALWWKRFMGQNSAKTDHFVHAAS